MKPFGKKFINSVNRGKNQVKHKLRHHHVCMFTGCSFMCCYMPLSNYYIFNLSYPMTMLMINNRDQQEWTGQRCHDGGTYCTRYTDTILLRVLVLVLAMTVLSYVY